MSTRNESSPTTTTYRHLTVYQRGNLDSMVLHVDGGVLCANGHPIKLFSDDRQRFSSSQSITGNELRKQFLLSLCGGGVIDDLLAAPEKFPAEWKQRDELGRVKFYFALGTVYGVPALGSRKSGRIVCFARGVYWDDGRVKETCHSMDSLWYDDIQLIGTEIDYPLEVSV